MCMTFGADFVYAADSNSSRNAVLQIRKEIDSHKSNIQSKNGELFKLTPEEIADGWQLLFDGKTLNGWKDYNGTTLTQPWHVVDGCIQAKGDGSDASGYIVTDKQYENFELSWDWKLSKGGNSGMLYHVVERPQFAVPYVTGPEYQLSLIHI